MSTAAMLFGGMAGPAAAQQQADGLIVVQIGDITTGDILSENEVAIGVAAQIAANVCGVKVGPVAVLGTAVDRSGDTRTVCETGDQFVRFTQN
ncbi:MAG: hypothetical protein M3Q18_02430 [Actinomycetota bacterium]|nr:hypothetical protein [Actinomycetota bacterium]